ncbi:MAG: HTH-type transcriptional regulator MalT [Anaerolineales bacterium]|nr:HTH-type transcriptional regulator MalT [Anaerolineales bacterium]WKZ46366.1 MAG: BTAD domain-containing putative transcriptional regulator [Anaerolineales bacterium]
MTKSSIPISKTKIIVPPRRRELLSRHRLLERLKSFLENKLVLLSASAGYGKTSLLIDLANHTDMPVCWLALDPLDRDPQRFMAYLIASLAERFPGVGESSLNLLNNLKTIETDAEALLVALTNELYDRVEDDYLLIIDDYHLLDESPVISSLINRFLQLVDENCHLIISSRTLPDLDDVTLMVAREQVAGLNHMELAFQPRELQALYAQNHHKHLSDEKASELINKTGGWITGMVLSDSTGVQVANVDTFSYLGRQVLDQQPQHIREFLLRTSLPEEFNAEFCEIVLGPFYATSQSWLELMGWILDKNLFVLPLEDGRWLRYHPLFREFLQSRMKKERPHEIQPILERMVKGYEAVGEWEKAYFTCKQLSDPDALAGLVERAGTPMLQTALVTLEGWINSLPPATIRSRPGLISLRGAISAMKGNLPEANALLDRAIDLYRKDNDTGGLALALVRRAHTLRLMGEYVSALKDVEEALQIAETDSSLQPLYAEALRIRGLNSLRLGQSRSAINDLERSLHMYKELKETGSIPILLAETAMIRATIGDVELAKELYQESLIWLREEKNYFTEADTLNNLSVLYLQLGEYELASDTFEQGLAAAHKSRNQHAESLILTGLGDLYTEIEVYDAASQAYEGAEAVSGEAVGVFLSNYLILARANLAILMKDAQSASQYLRQFKRKLKLNPSVYERGLWFLLEGRRNFLVDEYGKAVQLLQEGKSCFLQDGRESEYQWCLVWLMAAYEQSGNRQNACVAFRELLSLKNKSNYSLVIALYQASHWLVPLQSDGEIGGELGGLLQKSQQLSARLPSVRRTLRRHAQSIPLSAPILKVRALGRSEVSVNGRAVNISDWRVQSARDLFFFFLNKREAMPKEKIGYELWPEIRDEYVLKTRFKQDIYRLRKAVGRDVIVFEDENYRFNRDMDYEYDVDAFESYIGRARRVQGIKERIGYYRQAISLYEGHYLSDVNGDWILIERERLKILYLSALEDLARLYLETNQLQACIETCDLAIVHDRYNETIYELELRAYSAQGDRASVARRYADYKVIMEHDLGLAPSPEMESVYRELIV